MICSFYLSAAVHKFSGRSDPELHSMLLESNNYNLNSRHSCPGLLYLLKCRLHWRRLTLTLFPNIFTLETVHTVDYRLANQQTLFYVSFQRRWLGTGKLVPSVRGKTASTSRMLYDGQNNDVVVACWLFNVLAPWQCISGVDRLRQQYLLPHGDRCFR